MVNSPGRGEKETSWPRSTSSLSRRRHRPAATCSRFDSAMSRFEVGPVPESCRPSAFSTWHEPHRLFRDPGWLRGDARAARRWWGRALVGGGRRRTTGRRRRVDEGAVDAAVDAAAIERHSPDAPLNVVSDSAGCAMVTACPSGRGPSMVIVPCVDGGSYCIDSTEVSRAQYAAFVADGFPLTGQPPCCAANTTYEPDPACEVQPEVTHQGDHPQVCVDWCDADAFWRWAGKRLCAGVRLEADPQSNEWHNACSTGGAHTYCFGSTWDPDACNGEDHGLGTTAPVGSLPFLSVSRLVRHVRQRQRVVEHLQRHEPSEVRLRGRVLR